MLLGLSIALGVAVPVSAFVSILIDCPVCLFGMAKGALGVSTDSRQAWSLDFDVDSDEWDSHYALLPSVSHSRFGWELTAPVWACFVVCVILTAIAFRRRPTPPGHCQACDYDLTGNVSGICPECGTPVKRESKPA